MAWLDELLQVMSTAGTGATRSDVGDVLSEQITAEGTEQFVKGIGAGVAGMPVDIATLAMRPFGYDTPPEEVVGSSDWIGAQMDADPEDKRFIAGTFMSPDALDTAKGAALASALLVGKGRRASPSSMVERFMDAGGVDIQTGQGVTMDNLQPFMEYHGLPASAGKLGDVKTYSADGYEFAIPGGVDSDEPFSYADMMYLKANPIDPSRVPREMHQKIQRRMTTATRPDNLDSEEGMLENFNRFQFGMLSPNQPLTPNEFEGSKLRIRSREELEELANEIDWEPGDVVDKDHRKAVGDAMAIKRGTQSGEKGGLGLKGTADYTNLAELAKMTLDDPKWFLRKPDESWAEFSDRTMSQTRGLSSKVAAFSTVWQDPVEAAISAVDRHMARKFLPKMFETKKARKAWENGVRDRWNSQLEAGKVKGKKARNIDQVLSQPGGDKIFMERVMSVLSPKQMQTRVAKTGEINPNAPEHLARTAWLREPDKLKTMGNAYRQAIEENARLAEESGMGLFEQQWLEWDRLRRRLEPHEAMFPGLHKLPPMAEEDLVRSLTEHKAAGYFDSSKKAYLNPETGQVDMVMKPTRPMDIDKALYWTLGGGAVGGGVLQSALEEQNEVMQ